MANNSIQATLFGKEDKDKKKTVAQLERELQRVEELMSYDMRPVAQANFDKRAKKLRELLTAKTMQESNRLPSVTASKHIKNNDTQTKSRSEELKRHIQLEEAGMSKTSSAKPHMYTGKISAKQSRLEENAKDVDIEFTNLVSLDNICD